MKEIITVLVLILYPASGPPKIAEARSPSIERCWEDAKAFVAQDPEALDAIALGAGCHHGTPAKKGDPA